MKKPVPLPWDDVIWTTQGRMLSLSSAMDRVGVGMMVGRGVSVGARVTVGATASAVVLVGIEGGAGDEVGR